MMPFDQERKESEPGRISREVREEHKKVLLASLEKSGDCEKFCSCWNKFWALVAVGLRRGATKPLVMEIASQAYPNVPLGEIEKYLEEAENDWSELARKDRKAKTERFS
jgi:hypothetical protein